MKTLKSILTVIVMLLSSFCISCITMEEDGDYYEIDFLNNTESELYVVVRYSVYYESTGQYAREDVLCKDSSLYNKKRFGANWKLSLFTFDEDPENFLKSTDTLTIFILDKEEYEGKTWSQLVDSAHFRQIYYLSGDDIRLLNSKVPYPPSEAMRNMDMVPSYEEAVR